MGNHEKIFIALFIIISSFLIIFYCPITVTVQTITTTTDYSTYYTPGKLSPNFSTSKNRNTTSSTYEDNVCLWNIKEVSSTSGAIQKSPSINYGRLFLEEFLVLGISFVLYLIAKRFLVL